MHAQFSISVLNLVIFDFEFGLFLIYTSGWSSSFSRQHDYINKAPSTSTLYMYSYTGVYRVCIIVHTLVLIA